MISTPTENLAGVVWADQHRTGGLPSCIRIGAGWLRNHGYNKRMVP